MIKKKTPADNFLSLINNSFNYGVSAGLAYHFQGRLTFNAFYSYGLSSFIKGITEVDQTGNPIGDIEPYKNTFCIGLSYNLYHRKDTECAYK